MKRSKHLLLVLILSLLAGPVSAVLMRPLPIEELARTADLIVCGTVLGKSTHRDAEGRIYTRIELAVSEVWKGAVAGNSLSIFQGGGVVGDERQEVSGEAEYAVGEEVVAFLVLNSRGEAITRALGQGKFHVWLDQQSGAKLAHNLFHGMPDARHSAPGDASGTAARSKPERLKLSDLKQKVKEVKP